MKFLSIFQSLISLWISWLLFAPTIFQSFTEYQRRVTFTASELENSRNLQLSSCVTIFPRNFEQGLEERRVGGGRLTGTFGYDAVEISFLIKKLVREFANRSRKWVPVDYSLVIPGVSFRSIVTPAITIKVPSFPPRLPFKSTKPLANTLCSLEFRSAIWIREIVPDPCCTSFDVSVRRDVHCNATPWSRALTTVTSK